MARKKDSERDIYMLTPPFRAGAENPSTRLNHNVSLRNPARPLFPENPKYTLPTRPSKQNQKWNNISESFW
jgi:hypothetical protein